MGEEPENGDRDRDVSDSAEVDAPDRVHDWEIGLPISEEIIPLNQSLISRELAFAFSIRLEPTLSMLDVHRASQDTVYNLRRLIPTTLHANLPSTREHMERDSRAELDEETNQLPQKPGSTCDERTVKRPRLVWTPELHKRFIEVVAHLGEKKSVPKTIMELMNVDGLTRENVASHLQKYRIYLKRMQGISKEGPFTFSSHHLLVPAPDLTIERESFQSVPFPQMVPLPVFGLPDPRGIMTSNPYGASMEPASNLSG